MRLSKALIVIGLVAGVAACATRTVPPLPAMLAYPEFLYPTVPPGGANPDEAAAIGRRSMT